MNDILLALLPNDKDQATVMRNLDLSYMSKDKYGEVSVIKQGEQLPELSLKGVSKIHILAHGSPTDINGKSGEDFAQKLIESYGKDNIKRKTIILYSCEAAQGGNNSVMEKMFQKFVGAGITQFRLIAATGETFIMSSGEVRVLRDKNKSGTLSKQVDEEGGDERDKMAMDYLQEFGEGWKGKKVQENGVQKVLTAEEIKRELVGGKS